MSFDLYLFPAPSAPPLPRDTFLAAFDDSSLSSVTGENTVRYHNAWTGVEFSLSWSGGGDRAPDGSPNVHFNMNYTRPHFFALEAALVLERLAARLSLIVANPQDNAAAAVWDEARFRASWEAGNLNAVRVFRELGMLSEPLSLPRSLLAAYWNWNYYNKDLAEDFWLFDDLDVNTPRIRFFNEAGQARSFTTIWSLLPTAVPKVDYVLLMRDELPAPDGAERSKRPAWVRWEDLVAATTFEVRGQEERDEDHPHLIVASEEYQSRETAPDWFARWVVGLPDLSRPIREVAPGDILDEELLRD